MTAETVLQNILLEIGLDIPNAQLSSDRYDIRQIRAFMNFAGRGIARRAEWARLAGELTVAGGLGLVDLPADFGELAESGAVRVDKPGFHPVRVVTSPELWESLSARPSAQPYCHLSEGKLLFAPALPPEGAKVRYVSRNWVQGGDTIGQGGDVLLIPERLVEKGAIWRWKRQKGLPYDDALAEFEADLLAEFKADRGQA